MDVDDCLSKTVGSFGRYQICTYIFLSICLLFSTSHTLLIMFVGVDPSDLVRVNPRATKDSSILIEWDLMSRPWIGDLIQTLYFAGNLIGVFVFGQVSDKYGRRPTILIVLSFWFPVCMWTSLTTSWQTFACARFLTGLLQGSAGLVIFVYMQEIVGRGWWAVTGAYMNILAALGIGVLALIAFYIPAWRSLTRAVTYFQLVPFLYAIFLPESPRWLFSVGRISDSEQVLLYMAHRNGVKIQKISLAMKSTPPHHEPVPSRTALDLLKHNKTRTRIFIMIALWFVNSFVYYALTLAAGGLGGNIYVSATMSGLIELPSTFLCTFMVEQRQFGRRRTLTLFMFASGAACFVVMTSADYALVWGLIGKMTIAASFNVIYVFTPELFPTSNPTFSYFMHGVSSITAGCLATLLPETLGSKPPDSFDDL